MPQHSYIFAPTRELWPAASVNARVPPVVGPDGKPIKAERLARCQCGGRADDVGSGRADADQRPADRRRRLVRAAGLRDLQPVPAAAHRAESRATSRRGSTSCTRSSPARPITSCCGWRTACSGPHEKINHALVLGGKPGIGKDTILEPVKQAVGPWNFAEVSPKQLLGRFNGFVKSVILRVSEARDLGEFDRYAFLRPHEGVHRRAARRAARRREEPARVLRASTSAASSSPATTRPTASTCPPTTAGISWRGRRSRRPTSRTTTGAGCTAGTATAASRHVAEYLASRDLSGFDPKAPPPKTEAFWEIVNANRAPEDAELADVLDALGKTDTDGMSSGRRW